jgi:hypothetical protein
MDFKLLLLFFFLIDVGYKYVVTIQRNLTVRIKTLRLGAKIFKYLISIENNTQNVLEVLLSADILYIVFFMFMLTSFSKVRSYKGRPMATVSSIKMCVDFLPLLCFPHNPFLFYLS